MHFILFLENILLRKSWEFVVKCKIRGYVSEKYRYSDKNSKYFVAVWNRARDKNDNYCCCNDKICSGGII